jgi:hypothetical protein|tara:strand:- start:1052 stop:1636 length:585 start_codon:yes stop_codon:yes gene_type:complete
MKIDLLDDVAPASNEIGAVADMASRMLNLQDEINRSEDALKQKKQDLTKLAEQDLPDLMQELNIKDFTLSNGAKVEVNDIISGSVPAAGAIDRAKGDDKVDLEMRQENCFDWLRANGAGDLIKSNVEVQFGRDEDDACNTFIDELQDRHIYYKRAKAVHPGTLNSFIKERLSEGKEVPHDLFRIYTGRKAKIRR